jgi:hypothetical protein
MYAAKDESRFYETGGIANIHNEHGGQVKILIRFHVTISNNSSPSTCALGILGDYEEYRLLGSSTVWVRFEPTFRRNVSPPYSGQVNNTRSQVSR